VHNSKKTKDDKLAAGKVLRGACDTDMRDAEAHYRLGLLLINTNRRKEGEGELKKAHELGASDKTIKAAIESEGSNAC
jgi:Flp pilus assembly protein TadD